MDAAFIQARIDATKLLIVVYEDALSAFGTTNIQSYILDTGQTRQNVTRADLSQLNRVLSSLENRLATYCARLNGSGTTHMRAAW